MTWPELNPEQTFLRVLLQVLSSIEPSQRCRRSLRCPGAGDLCKLWRRRMARHGRRLRRRVFGDGWRNPAMAGSSEISSATSITIVESEFSVTREKQGTTLLLPRVFSATKLKKQQSSLAVVFSGDGSARKRSDPKSFYNQATGQQI